jgi:hypothetical protein
MEIASLAMTGERVRAGATCSVIYPIAVAIRDEMKAKEKLHHKDTETQRRKD